MKITYNKDYKTIIINGDNTLCIPLNNSPVIEIDADSINRFNKDTGALLQFENFVAYGLSKIPINVKFKLIWKIIKA